MAKTAAQKKMAWVRSFKKGGRQTTRKRPDRYDDYEVNAGTYPRRRPKSKAGRILYNKFWRDRGTKIKKGTSSRRKKSYYPAYY